jgi:hypothetical protein
MKIFITLEYKEEDDKQMVAQATSKIIQFNETLAQNKILSQVKITSLPRMNRHYKGITDIEN